MQSMTGYGRGTATIDGRSLTVELKSVNHRFLDLNFRMPRGMMFLEDDARKQISGRVSRGHVDVFMTYKNTRSDMRRVDVDENLAGAYMQAIAKLEALGLKGDLTAMGVARMPDVLTVTEADEDQDALRQLLAEALGAALDQLVAMRVREGESMRKDLLEKAAAIEDINSRIEQRYPQTVEEYRDRLKASVMELIGQNMDESRLITEVAIMAEKSAIAEETVRLKSHIRQMRELLQSDDAIGRRLDFLVQELNREVNTISSKSQDVPITRLAVDAKAEIEKLREQLQNIE